MTKKIEIAALCKGVHCVDLGERLQTHIYLKKLASIQPRTAAAAAENEPLKVCTIELQNDFNIFASRR